MSGVEGIFLIFAMKNVVNKSLHHLLIIIGVMIPPLVVFFVLGFSFTTNEKIYMTTYDADGKLMMNAASFEENMNTVCWIRPDYIVRLVLSRMPRYQKMILTKCFKHSLKPDFSTFQSASSSSPTSLLSSRRLHQPTNQQSSGEIRCHFSRMM